MKNVCIIFSVLILSLLSCKDDKTTSSKQKVYQFTKEGELTLTQGNESKTINIEFAESEVDRNKGLMDRDSIGPDDGMLFIFSEEEERVQGFWMRNTRFSLDLIYISRDSLVVDIQRNAIPYYESNIPSDTISRYVLEVNAGKANEWNIKENETKVSWKKF